MSAKEYYSQSETKETYNRPNIPPPGHGKTAGAPNGQYVETQNERGFFSGNQQQPQYYQQQQYQQQQYPPQQYPQYYQQGPPQHQQQPIYVQQQPPKSGNQDCLTACLAAMCICCTLDMLF
ncbi:uncharacterized protein TDEL_0D04340 [Torulaspora delbrueckii]|uniref:Cysteine-rich transmembrane domain-containing protein n=1 Tax=Torulaspora delbrueckii TaxID=4950 RepID=G8ZTS4_TORDE|nr:hypothetical protein TDEL_0D04340 [Torulaspora delbrueckii]CCE92018.1 hypothetical protein TDEL_0D04340 [Torulaspora delbrueckii]